MAATASRERNCIFGRFGVKIKEMRPLAILHGGLAALWLLAAGAAAGDPADGTTAGQLDLKPLDTAEFRTIIWQKLAANQDIPLAELVRAELELLDEAELRQLVAAAVREVIHEEIRALAWQEFRHIGREELQRVVQLQLRRTMQREVTAITREEMTGIPEREMRLLIDREYQRLLEDGDEELRTTIQRAVQGSLMRESFSLAREMMLERLGQAVRPAVEREIGALTGAQLETIINRAVREARRAAAVEAGTTAGRDAGH